MRFTTLAAAVALTAALPVSARAAEICGNGQDDDNDTLADEGCYPALTTSQCESPLTCEETGMVSPSTGSLRYSLAADIAPRVPYGPSIGFRRFYLSMNAPGGAAPAYRKPMGERWGHTYMSWLDKHTTPNPDQIVVHLPRGQDALFQYSGTSGGWDQYNTFQHGFHFQYLRQRTTSPNEYELKTLTGEVFVYNASGKLTQIKDSLQTPNVVTISYDGNGQVATVLDASGRRRLLFGYTGALLTSVAFQLSSGGAWSTYHTTSYGYTSGNLTTVTIGGQLAQTNVYSGNYVTSIQDGAGNALVNFVYDGTVAGKIARVDTPRGLVGYETASARASCSGQTVLYFHRGNSTSCSVDADCGSGFLCGGKTGAGATGVCFRGARCLTVTSPSEDVVTTVSAIGPPGETCEGACLDAAEYIWNTAGRSLDLAAVKDPSSYYTVKELNGNGLPTKIVYGDTDANPATGGERVVFLSYDTSFPGRVSEIRRKSELDPSGGSCSATNTSGCARSLFFYNADGLVSSSEAIGTTLAATGSTTGYRYITSYTYDAQGKGRLAQIDGPLPGSNDVTVFEYWSSIDPTKDGFLQNLKRKKDSTSFLVQSSLALDFWGNATTLQDVDGTISCQTFDAARGYLAQRREAMNGQTDCTAHSSDLVTSWERDSALRLTKLTRPDGSCLHYEYDSRGRLLRTKRRDDCTAASSGDREEYTYSVEGLLTKVDTFDASSTVTRRQELTYFDSRRLEKILNPVNTAKWTGMVYDPRGLVGSVAAVDGANNLSKTEWLYNADGRVTDERRYTAGSAFDTWSLLFDWLGNQKRVTDGDSKQIESIRDDLGRTVKLVSPDLGGAPTLRIFDEANRLVTLKEGSGTPMTHAFTFDQAGRPLNADYAGFCQHPSTGQIVDNPDIVRTYDAPPGACPSGASCSHTAGRLAHVKVKLMCQSTLGDLTLEQETWYGYDAAGRLTSEHIQDDNGRVASQQYEWTKNGALAKVTLPSTAAIGWSYGSAGSNSDTDRISALWRTSTATPIGDQILWEPYGPLKQYNQQNTVSTVPLRTKITRNLAYRITTIEVETQTTGSDVHRIGITEDAAGRVTRRDYYSAPNGLQDSYFRYDQQNRVLCETTTSVSSCPTSGTNIKNGHSASPPFTAAGDWKQLLRPIPGVTGLTHDFTLTSGTHQIASVVQPTLGTTAFTYDARGNRSSDDNTSTLTHDARTYTYDARRNVTNVRGQYYTGGAWHYYNVGSAFDAKNRRVFKSFYDETTGQTAHWFFYYDALDRLTEVRHTPDTASPGTYTLFQLFWLDNRPVLYWQTDYPSAAISRRYIGTDETERPIDMICWSNSPGSNCPRVWSINPDVLMNDEVLVGAGVYQPITIDRGHVDFETVVLQNDGVSPHRTNLVLLTGLYDPFTGEDLRSSLKNEYCGVGYAHACEKSMEHGRGSGLSGCPGQASDGVSLVSISTAHKDLSDGSLVDNAMGEEDSSDAMFRASNGGLVGSLGYLDIGTGRHCPCLFCLSQCRMKWGSDTEACAEFSADLDCIRDAFSAYRTCAGTCVALVCRTAPC